MAKQADLRGLAFGMASALVLLGSGLWLALGSFSTRCASEQVLGSLATRTQTACTSSPSNFQSHGFAAVAWYAGPAVLALLAMALTPLDRARTALRATVAAVLLPLALFLAFTPFMFLLIVASALMVLSAVFADGPQTSQVTRTRWRF